MSIEPDADMRHLRLPLLCIFCLAAVGCGSLREVRTTYNPDGTIRENVRLSARSLLSKDGLRGLRYSITGGTNDINRRLEVDAYDRDVSTNASPVVDSAGNVIGRVISTVVSQ